MDRSVYRVVLAGGLLLAVYIYGFAFDSHSEEELVQLTFVWFTAIVFGISGLTAVSLIERLKYQPEKPLRKELISTLKPFGIFSLPGQILLFPMFFVNVRNSFVLASISAMFWLAILALFFILIFPSL